MIAYKLFHVRKDGSLGPLYCGRKLRIPVGEWLEAEDHPTRDFSDRPFWHVATEPDTSHLKANGARENRAWYKVEVTEITEFPCHQGWYLAKWLRIVEKV